MSDPQPDGSAHALTVIAFIGSVFSPYYAQARRRRGDAAAAPEAHCALNVALYRRAPGSDRYHSLWAMTERGAPQLHSSPQHLQIGPSALHWDAQGNLHVDIEEWTAPLPRRLRGHIVLRPQVLPGRVFALDAAGRHHWQPISPRARIEVEFASPRLRWQGEAYLDANQGERPLERDFSEWHWSRSAIDGQRSRVNYEVRSTDGSERLLALEIDPAGRIELLPPPAPQALARTGWGLARSSRTGPGSQLMATLESGPFYSRSLLRDPGDGTMAVHETLSLQRFSQGWVQAMLPFRMPRSPMAFKAPAPSSDAHPRARP